MEATQDNVVVGHEPAIHAEKSGYLFGFPIAHSFSPILHSEIFKQIGSPWTFDLLESTDMPHFLELIRDQRLYGSAVTMPHKVAIIPYLDGLTDEGRDVGAVNTIFRRGDQIIGTNTDTIGVRESFYQNVANPNQVFHGRPGMVVGGGGAARSAIYALVKFMQCKTIYLVNRDPSEVEAVMEWCKSQGYGDGLVHVTTAAQAESLEGPGAIVACVPNFPPVTDAEKEARNIVEVFLSKSHKGAMLEMCYHPSPWTELGDLAEKAGWQVVLGTEAMIYQGFEQHKYWHGTPMSQQSIQAVKDVIARELGKARL
ncbi:related to ARO1-arom pentafunctional enzyme [Ramularia collo-cygni]|uniref:Related to ARO1-arom pentafunctional enzyme n=1 Tax=Ramularia collo-cygni TaxID=112498 RepID=A0A2D3UZ15_9PEZI|nr:related to ARO1-arom pentafunctional enzyme [Ramularia collo-cygni]CZT16456.1 related to ARO1-arom pentafunctional enzyme [Ramularia collo-cygni]